MPYTSKTLACIFAVMALKRQMKLGAINVSILFSFLLLIELLCGEWVKVKPHVASLPDTRWNKKIIFDAATITGEKRTLYTVDARGYRGNIDYHKKNIVLTIGGSTTEQLLVGDGKTWQDKLNLLYKNRYQFVNGGFGGQSTFGHIFAIRAWHSKEFMPSQVRAVIFYFGINDLPLLREQRFYNQNETPKVNIYQFKIFLLRNSFFYQRLKTIKDNFYARDSRGSSNELAWSGHFHRSRPFVDTRLPQPIFQANHYQYSHYKDLIARLIYLTRSSFPAAKIIFVQQQIPGCLFIGPLSVINRHPEGSYSINRCRELGRVYLEQDDVVASLPRVARPKILKMYLHRILLDDDVYDYVHTNVSGSSKIALYLGANIGL